MDIHTALTLLNIDPELRQYICCPTCCSLYGPFLEQPSDYHGVPDSCSHRATPTSPPCGASLFQESKKQGVRIPSRRFSYQPLRSWLARFLSRADVMASLRQTPGPMTDTMYDIWDGSVLRQFKGPDGEAFFKSNPSNTEIHLAFSMFVDWFNLFGTKQSGKHVSFVLRPCPTPGLIRLLRSHRSTVAQLRTSAHYSGPGRAVTHQTGLVQ